MNDLIIPGKDIKRRNDYVSKQLSCPCYDLLQQETLWLEGLKVEAVQS